MQCCTARYALLDGVRGHRDILISCPRPAAHAAEQDLDSAQGCYEAEPDPIIPERNWVSDPGFQAPSYGVASKPLAKTESVVACGLRCDPLYACTVEPRYSAATIDVPARANTISHE